MRFVNYNQLFHHYRRGDLNNVVFKKSYLNIDNYYEDVLPMIAITVALFNMGFRQLSGRT